MKDITNNFLEVFSPKSALIFYQKKGRDEESYVEHFDMDKNGFPINAHPLTVMEARKLAKVLAGENKSKQSFLLPSGVMKADVLYLNQTEGKVIWFTKAMERKLHFSDNLNIPSGMGNVPAMLWVADSESLSVFALSRDRRPTEKTTLYHAPFFNIYDNGTVCMGTVDTRIKHSASLEEFMSAWENFFFNSYFNHLLAGHNPVDGNCVMLWQSLIEKGDAFPTEILKTSRRTIKDLIR